VSGRPPPGTNVFDFLAISFCNSLPFLLLKSELASSLSCHMKCKKVTCPVPDGDTMQSSPVKMRGRFRGTGHVTSIFRAEEGNMKQNTALHLYLSWARPIQSTTHKLISKRSSLMLSIHLRLGLPSRLFPTGFPTNNLYTSLFSLIHATCPAHLIFLNIIILIITFVY
jgi:hypothetical protein